MNTKKNFLLKKSKKLLFLMTMALVAISAMGLFLLSENTFVSAQEETPSASKTVTRAMLTLALNFGSAADYTVFADKGIIERDSRIGGKTNVANSDVRAKKDITDAFNILENLPCTERNEELRSGKYNPGVYCARMGDLKGGFLLDGEGNPNAIFIFRSEGDLRAGSDLNVSLVNGASAHNVFFVSGDTAEIDGVNLNGNVIAKNSVKISSDATVGRALSVNGKVDVKSATVEGATGVLQICKTALGPGLDDRIFRFQIGANIFLVPVGSCSGPITLPAGPVVIDELLDGPTIPSGTFSGRFSLVDVNTDPADALIDEDLRFRRIMVNVRPSAIQNQTVVEFVNTFAVNAIVEICKFPAQDMAIVGGVATPIARSDSAAAQGDANIRDRDVPLGTLFIFTIDPFPNFGVFVPVGGCSPAIQVNLPTSTGPVPASGEIFITEMHNLDENDNVLSRLDGAPESLAVTTFPADRLNSIDFNIGLDDSNNFTPYFNPGGGVVGVDVLEGGVSNQTTVNFWNRSEPGFVKVCKVAGPGIPVGTRFAFDVYGREPSNTDRMEVVANGTLPGGFPPTIPQPGNILPGVDTVRRVTVPAGPGPLGFCEFVRTGSPDPTGGRVQYIVGSQVLVHELGIAGTPYATPIDPVPGIPAVLAPGPNPFGGPLCSPAGPNCPQPQTDPPTGVRVSNIRLNAGASSFVSPSSIVNTNIPAGLCTTAQGNASTNAAGSLTLNPNPSFACRAAIFRARRGTVEVEFTDFLFRPVLLKVCKTSVPGGPAVGSLVVFSFTVNNQNGTLAAPFTTVGSVTVPVGGCAFVQGPFTPTATVPPTGTFAFGQIVTISEPAGNNLQRCNVLAGTLDPAAPQPNPNLQAGTCRVILNATTVVGGIAVNEVEIVNGSSTAPVSRAFDFDGDGKADISVFRPDEGNWYLLNSSSGFAGVNFGLGTDKIVPGDYDGDGKTDIAVFRNGAWYLLRSQLGFTAISFGLAEDIPLPADYDGDGKADLAVLRPSNGSLYILQSSSGLVGINLGQNGGKPVIADYDGDGKADIGIFRNGSWYLLRSHQGFVGVTFGIATDIPVPADYDGDGKADLAVFRAETGVWYILRSRDGFLGFAFGLGTDKPVPADYDGDGKTDIAVFRDGIWYIQRTTAGFLGVQFGTATDKPIPNAYIP